MRHICACTLVLFLTAAPVAAQTEDAPNLPETLEEFADSMRKLFEGFADDVAPMMEDLAGRLEGLRGYHPPEMLPNGDIIIRRKSPAETAPDPAPSTPEDGIDI